MSSGTFIIQSALEEIGAHSVMAPAPPESIEAGQRRLNSMLQRWGSWGIKIPFSPLKVAGDELDEPADTTDAIVFNLALELSGKFSNGSAAIVSPDLRMNAADSFKNVKQTYRTLTVPNKRMSSTTPRGIGNFRGSNSRNIFFDQDEPLSK